MLGVREYLLFDPFAEYLSPRFQVFELHPSGYHWAELDPDGGVTSRALGVRFVPDGPLLRVIDPRTGAPVPSLEEQGEQLEEKSHLLEEKSHLLEETTERLEEKSHLLEETAGRLEEERRRADRLEAELDRLRKRLPDPDDA